MSTPGTTVFTVRGRLITSSRFAQGRAIEPIWEGEEYRAQFPVVVLGRHSYRVRPDAGRPLRLPGSRFRRNRDAREFRLLADALPPSGRKADGCSLSGR